MLDKVKVDLRLGEGSRTLLREPIVIVRGVYLADFELLDPVNGVLPLIFEG
ncbi:MAG TPA: hypothetical protein VMJ65_11395 [Solirubrobacteraceae bacterium]|nr:hypothetical protein [Solirubrobacteraceae bacterium]